MSHILDLLELEPSRQSVDFVENKQQFHLFTLLTEQRHTKTWNLSFIIQADTEAGLRMLLSVDEDISAKIQEFIADPSLLYQAAEAVTGAILKGHKIYIYGCGATGRLAKQMESSFWRPFWRKAKSLPVWEKLREKVGERIEDALIGEMTGADRALVSSLEGFEDLQLIGKLQSQDHGVRKGDTVICVTEGGETSSVIGTILAALEQYGPMDHDIVQEARKHLYFVCNNPEAVLYPFARSAAVLHNPAITHINLTTGPQAITGSTRMQATTIETFVVGAILEEALYRILCSCLRQDELTALGFDGYGGLNTRLADFDKVKAAVDHSVSSIAQFSNLEAGVYRRRRYATYLADRAMITVFIDSTERSPTFRLYPLDKVEDPERHAWVQVWTDAGDLRSAWHNFLGRPFKGLDPARYQVPFERLVDDPYLREAALRSLKNAGNDQELSYDFSFSDSNIARRGPEPGDLGVLVLLDDELEKITDPESAFSRFVDFIHSRGGSLALIAMTDDKKCESAGIRLEDLIGHNDVLVQIPIKVECDPLTLCRQVGLKMVLNAHSTGIMAMLGRVIGNTMTSVSPSNLKLIGRATYLIMSHVNDILIQPEWIARNGKLDLIGFAEANAVLLDAMEYVKTKAMGQTAEVALSIIRVVEAFARGSTISWEEAERLLETAGLAAYLLRHNPSLAL
jgi:N-acetylmuramic acid 6-phosphate etherase